MLCFNYYELCFMCLIHEIWPIKQKNFPECCIPSFMINVACIKGYNFFVYTSHFYRIERSLYESSHDDDDECIFCNSRVCRLLCKKSVITTFVIFFFCLFFFATHYNLMIACDEIIIFIFFSEDTYQRPKQRQSLKHLS